MIEQDILLRHGGFLKVVATDEIIIEEDSQSNYYYQLVSGRLRAVNINEQCREYLQYLIHPGETFAEIPMILDMHCQITVIADEPSIIIKVPKENFQELLQNNPEYQSRLSKVLANRLVLRYIIAKEFINNNPQHRILSLLNYLKEEGKDVCLACNKVELTRQEIADMLGFRVETVIRSIRDLNDKGLLEIKSGKVFYPHLIPQHDK